MTTTADEEWKKSLLEKAMRKHIEEFRLFQSLCTGLVHDDERGVAWQTWCMRTADNGNKSWVKP